ncbi:hypothetical protein CA236_11895 [Sphingomonas sp. ABOLG]|jgi:hypothetical protein|uniref:hypothetical protein n=1 Tax=Sphingomonas TaxID=13687 RepID=UPI0006222F57|nr:MULTISPECIES: hypothetical protein [unclassified Sphingomonas]KKI17812.1 hypothetical protein XM50_16330 [Sphingomonas sp. Ag1]RSV16888.1 hypothetical protein CA236_11895 [Sphingomonas sp. ABOLG]
MTITAIATAALMLGAAPEPAPRPAPAPAPAPTIPADQYGARSFDPETDQRRVCVIDTLSGPGIARRYCQTRATWVAQGTDPLARR